MFAVKMNNLEIVKEILKSKSAKLQLGFQTGSALPEPARKILAHFSKPNSISIFDADTRQPIPVGITNQDITLPIGSTALSIAVQNANADMVQILLRNYEWDKGYLVSLLRTDAEIKINEDRYKPINELLSDHGNPAAKRRRPDVTEKALEAPEAPLEHEIILEPAKQQVSSSQQQQQEQHQQRQKEEQQADQLRIFNERQKEREQAFQQQQQQQYQQFLQQRQEAQQQHLHAQQQALQRQAPSLKPPQTGWVPSVVER
jgi:hypothetical protein